MIRGNRNDAQDFVPFGDSRRSLSPMRIVPKVGCLFYRDTHREGRQSQGQQLSIRSDQFPSPRPCPNTNPRHHQTAVTGLSEESADPCSSPTENEVLIC